MEPNINRLTEALEATLSELADAEDCGDDAQIWRLTRQALGTLYEFEEAERANDPDYYVHRDASEAGRTLGGLMWLRGSVVHRQAEARDVSIPGRMSLITEDEEGVMQTLPGKLSLVTSSGQSGGLTAHAQSGGSLSLIIGGMCPPRSLVPTSKPETKGETSCTTSTSQIARRCLRSEPRSGI